MIKGEDLPQPVTHQSSNGDFADFNIDLENNNTDTNANANTNTNANSNSNNALEQFLYDSLSKADSANFLHSYFESPNNNSENDKAKSHNENIDEMEIDSILNNFTVSTQTPKFDTSLADDMNVIHDSNSSNLLQDDSLSSATSMTASNKHDNFTNIEDSSFLPQLQPLQQQLNQPSQKHFSTSPSIRTVDSQLSNSTVSPPTTAESQKQRQKLAAGELDRYKRAIDELKKLKFGGFNINDEDLKNPAAIRNQIPPNLFLPEDSVSWDPETDYASVKTNDKLPYKIKIGSLPEFSRVETQIKVDVMIHPRPPNYLVRLSTDLVSKKKFCLKDGISGLPEDLQQDMLHLDCYVVSGPLSKDANGKIPVSESVDKDLKLDGLLQTDKFMSCNICSKCIKRELKRASRRKNGLSEDGLNWIDVIPKKAIIFNSKELISLPPPTVATPSKHPNLNFNGFRLDNTKNYGFNFFGFGNSKFEKDQSNDIDPLHSENPDDLFSEQNCSKLELSARIVCYCRHHHAQKGFKLLFVLRNNKGEIVGKNFSDNIMIMDRKKSMETGNGGSSANECMDARQTSIGSKRGKSIDMNPITPPSLDDDSSDHKTSDSKSSKRAKLSSQNLSSIYLNSRNSSVAKPNDFAKLGSMHSVNDFEENMPNAFNNSINQNVPIVNNNNMMNNSRQALLFLDANSLSPVSDNAVSSSTAYNSRSPGDSAIMTSFTSLSSPNFIKQDRQSNSVGNNQFPSQLTGQATSQLASPVVTNSMIPPPFLPMIQKVIPSEGPIRGGIEITLLGVNFRPGLKVKFGDVKALGTHCWSDSTIVTYLPPASAPGQVLVSFEANEGNTELNDQFMKHEHSQIFTYNDDTDRQLIELALQIVGLKMNGKLEDARNIARRIVGNDSSSDKGGSNNEGNPGISPVGYSNTLNFYDAGEEDLLLRLINVCDLPNAPSSPNWQICTKEKQTMLHLACFKGLPRVASALINRGARVNSKDVNGFTPLHFAALGCHSKIVKMLHKAKANTSLKNNFGVTASGVTQNLQIRALIRELDARKAYMENENDYLLRSGYGISTSISSTSISSLSSLEEDDLRYHVSRMVVDRSRYSEGLIANEDVTAAEQSSPLLDSSESDNADDEEEIDDVFASKELGSNDADIDDDLPKYDDLYPHGDPTVLKQAQLFEAGTSSRNNSTVGSSKMLEGEALAERVMKELQEDSKQVDVPVNTENGIVTVSSTPVEGSDIDGGSEEADEPADAEDSDASQENMFNYYMYFSEKNKATKVSNDKMLLFFWVPLLLVIASVYIYSQFAGIDFINGYGEETVNHLREGMYKLMLGKERMEGIINDRLNILTMDVAT